MNPWIHSLTLAITVPTTFYTAVGQIPLKVKGLLPTLMSDSFTRFPRSLPRRKFKVHTICLLTSSSTGVICFLLGDPGNILPVIMSQKFLLEYEIKGRKGCHRHCTFNPR